MYQPSLLTPHPIWLPDALRLLAAHRFLTVRQLASVLGVHREELQATLNSLVAEGALRALSPSTLVGRDGGATAYALTPVGLAHIEVDPGALRNRAARSLRSAFSLSHELLVNEIALVLRALDQKGILKLLSWQTARERIGAATFIALEGKPVRVPLVADGLAVLERHGRAEGLLFEADLGTVSVKTMRRKYQGYADWWADGGPYRRLGITAIRVVTVAPAPRRLERLRAAAIEGLDGKRGSGFLWFLPESAVDVSEPERFVSEAALVAKRGEDRPGSLFGA